MTLEELDAVGIQGIEDDGAIDSLVPYVFFRPASKTIQLDGDFTAEQLEALAQWLRAYLKPLVLK